VRCFFSWRETHAALRQSDDDLTHFTWRERTSAEAEVVRGRRASRSRRAGTR
jgi:hypothetical protein